MAVEHDRTRVPQQLGNLGIWDAVGEGVPVAVADKADSPAPPPRAWNSDRSAVKSNSCPIG
jgi:hypothetical protein